MLDIMSRKQVNIVYYQEQDTRIHVLLISGVLSIYWDAVNASKNDNTIFQNTINHC